MKGDRQMMKKGPEGWYDLEWNPFTGCGKRCKDCQAMDRAEVFMGNVMLNIGAATPGKIATYGDKKIFQLDEPWKTGRNGSLNTPFGALPTFHRYRLGLLEQRKVPANIAVCLQGDLFSNTVPDEVIRQIFDTCRQTPRHNYLFLTCNPARVFQLINLGTITPEDKNFWFGTRTDGEDTAPVATLSGENTFLYLTGCRRPILTQALGTKWVVASQSYRPAETWVEGAQCNLDEAIRRGGVPLWTPETPIFPPELLHEDMSEAQHRRRYAQCLGCGKEAPCKSMICITAGRSHGQNGKAIGYFCGPCFEDFCKQHNINIKEDES